MRINLPEEVQFTCPGCTGKFRLQARLLHGREQLTCPSCAVSFTVYDGLPAMLKRKAYHALRDELERIMYNKYNEHHTEFASGWDGPGLDIPPSED